MRTPVLAYGPTHSIHHVQDSHTGLRIPYEISSTYCQPYTLPTRSPVLTYGMPLPGARGDRRRREAFLLRYNPLSLCAPYAMSGTVTAHICAPHAMSGTALDHKSVSAFAVPYESVRPLAMSGTDNAYGAIRHQDPVRGSDPLSPYACAIRCPVLPYCIALRILCAISSTVVRYGPTHAL